MLVIFLTDKFTIVTTLTLRMVNQGCGQTGMSLLVFQLSCLSIIYDSCFLFLCVSSNYMSLLEETMEDIRPMVMDDDGDVAEYDDDEDEDEEEGE